MGSPWKVLVEVPSNDPDRFLSTVRLTSLEALRIRLGDGFYMEAMRQVTGRPRARSRSKGKRTSERRNLAKSMAPGTPYDIGLPIDVQNVAPMTHGDSRSLCGRRHSQEGIKKPQPTMSEISSGITNHDDNRTRAGRPCYNSWPLEVDTAAAGR